MDSTGGTKGSSTAIETGDLIIMAYVRNFYLHPSTTNSDFFLIAFDIHAPDDPGPFGGRFDGAPSRPPSRTSNNKSPLSKVIDLTAEHALGLYSLPCRAKPN